MEELWRGTDVDRCSPFPRFRPFRWLPTLTHETLPLLIVIHAGETKHDRHQRLTNETLPLSTVIHAGETKHDRLQSNKRGAWNMLQAPKSGRRQRPSKSQGYVESFTRWRPRRPRWTAQRSPPYASRCQGPRRETNIFGWACFHGQDPGSTRPERYAWRRETRRTVAETTSSGRR